MFCSFLINYGYKLFWVPNWFCIFYFCCRLLAPCGPWKLCAHDECQYLKGSSHFFEWFLSELYFYLKINTTIFKTLLDYVWFVKGKVKFAQLCLTLGKTMDYRVHGILQARILEWVTFPFFRGSSQPRDQTRVPRIAGRFFISWDIREAPCLVYTCLYLVTMSLTIHTEMFNLRSRIAKM